MSFQLQGGSAANNDYDYESGSGMDSFISRSIDEVSWQSNLNSQYVTLSNLPIGSSPTTATPTNLDATQVTGSQGGTATIGQTQIAQDGTISTTTSTGSPAITIGVLG